MCAPHAETRVSARARARAHTHTHTTAHARIHRKELERAQEYGMQTLGVGPTERDEGIEHGEGGEGEAVDDGEGEEGVEEVGGEVSADRDLTVTTDAAREAEALLQRILVTRNLERCVCARAHVHVHVRMCDIEVYVCVYMLAKIPAGSACKTRQGRARERRWATESCRVGEGGTERDRDGTGSGSGRRARGRATSHHLLCHAFMHHRCQPQ